jgi:hypothetical protein
MKLGWTIFTMALVLLIVPLVYFFGPGGTGTIGSLVLGDKTEIRIVQTYNDCATEPYTVSFYVRRPGENWAWWYLDHQDLRWPSARLVVDKKTRTVQIYRGSTLRGEYEIDDRKFALWRNGSKSKSSTYQTLKNPPV